MVELKIDDIKFQVAENWNELNKNQLLWLAGHFHWLVSESTYEQKIKCFLALLNIPKMHLKKIKKVHLIDDLQMFELSKCADFLFGADKIDLTNNPMPEISVRFKKFYGPANGLSNISLAEFAYADLAFIDFVKNKKQESLDKLVAILYRKIAENYNPDRIDFKNDKRQPFNSYKITHNTKIITNLNVSYKILILIFYFGCRNQICKLYKNVFNPKVTSKAASLNLGFLEVIFELSGEKFGNIDETGQCNMHVALAYIENQIIKNIKPI